MSFREQAEVLVDSGGVQYAVQQHSDAVTTIISSPVSPAAV